jgi:predicted nucleotidyltransferase component of viral defense system
MITKAELLEFATETDLLATTVEKDYALGWILAGIAQNSELSKWAFKGGTCLKKCFFETYRFSEDLDFTVPRETPLSAESISTGLREVLGWTEQATGIQFPEHGVEVERHVNPRGRESFQARATYVGPLSLPRKSLQRVKFDITQDELLVDPVDFREIFHPYSDKLVPMPRVCCYSVNEILAEKSRALYERNGRARDVYDIVHLSREFRPKVDPTRAAQIAKEKFAFKQLPDPTVELIVSRVVGERLRADWDQQLRHQVPRLPPVDGFLQELPDAIAWWLDPAKAHAEPAPVPEQPGEQTVPREFFPLARGGAQRFRAAGETSLRAGGTLARIRGSARNRLCAEIRYHGVSRMVEPYSLRMAATGNLLLYAFELSRGGQSSNQMKAYKVAEIAGASITTRPFRPRYRVEM